MFIIDFFLHILCINEQQFSVEIYQKCKFIDFDKYYLYILTCMYLYTENN